MPDLTAAIIRELDEAGLLGRHIAVVGTNAVYAYEAMGGVHVASPLLETTDADLLWDAGEVLSLAVNGVRRPAIIALLQRVDRTFDASSQYGFAAQNGSGYIVELLGIDDGKIGSTGVPGDLDVNPMPGMDALLALPRMEAIVIDRRGMPLRIVVPDIRAWVQLKVWVSRQQSHQPEKRRRDRDQALVVRQIAEAKLGLSVDHVSTDLPGYLRS